MDAPHGAAQVDGDIAAKHARDNNDTMSKVEDIHDAKRQKTEDEQDGDVEMENAPAVENGAATNGDALSQDASIKQDATNNVPNGEDSTSVVPTAEAPASETTTPAPVKQEQNGDAFAHLNQPEGEPMPKPQQKQALSIIKSLKRLKDAGPFNAPVDPVKLGIPTYLDVVKQPMDLGTMEKKASGEEYSNVSAFVNDFNLIVSNCILFNGSESPISQMAKNLQNSFTKYMANMPAWDAPEKKKKKPVAAPLPPVSPGPKSQRAAAHVASAAVAAEAAAGQLSSATAARGPAIRRESTTDGRPKREIHPPKPKDLPYTEMRPRKKKFAAELRFCNQVLKELTSKKHQDYSYPFLQPVDPVALGCPEYFDVIQHPMDLSTIQDKLNRNIYENSDEFVADIRLMFNNCYRFNPAGTPVNDLGHRLERVFDKKWTEKPAPVQSPAPHESEASDYSDFDDEYASVTSPTIELLEKQIAEMKQQLHRLKKAALREAREERMKGGGRRKPKAGEKRKGEKSTSGGAGSGPRRASNSGFNKAQPHVTFDMKKELSEKIPVLDEDKLQHVIKIIQASLPDLTANDEEIELDMDSLDNKTLLKLYDFVIKGDKPGKAKKERSGSMNKSKKSRKPLSEAEQSRQIEELKEKIDQFTKIDENGGVVRSGSVASTQQQQAQESDSSSEEENNDDARGGTMDSDESSSEEE